MTQTQLTALERIKERHRKHRLLCDADIEFLIHLVEAYGQEQKLVKENYREAKQDDSPVEETYLP